MSDKPLVLVVEDEADLLSTLIYNLEREGYRAIGATHGSKALELAAASPQPDIILLDLMLPDLSGNVVCRRLRADTKTQTIPILMLTARSEEVDRVVGFESGADDFVPKPFSVRELMLRIQAILRRAQGPTPEGPEEIQFGLLRLDLPGRRVWVGQGEIKLTPLEFRLLYFLLQHRGRVQRRETLLEHVWGIEAEITTRTVDTHVRRLRQKLGDAGHYIETLRGSGYCIREEIPNSPHGPESYAEELS